MLNGRVKLRAPPLDGGTDHEVWQHLQRGREEGEVNREAGFCFGHGVKRDHVH